MPRNANTGVQTAQPLSSSHFYILVRIASTLPPPPGPDILLILSIQPPFSPHVLSVHLVISIYRLGSRSPISCTPSPAAPQARPRHLIYQNPDPSPLLYTATTFVTPSSLSLSFSIHLRA
ncbi:hypothetical protein IF1G_08167 [Cordyceps javanica]|uniref:Uncharacterized protein n=1 Tax=Cordyceps javanica TaxID=43265 RepID=A0A545UTR8_9HYPO|nr:hypothetical protein IF1G_08167 [Cordyceps javanica]